MSVIAWVAAVVTSLGLGGEADIWQYEPGVQEWVQSAAVMPLESCLTITYEWDENDTPTETGREYVNLEPWEIRADIVGFYLWTQFDVEREDASADVGVSSVPLEAGSDRVEICR